MTGLTHIAIGVSLGVMGGASAPSLGLLAAGSLLPDLDTPKSTIGKILIPLSIPISRWLGHRGAMHSFWLWALVMTLGLLWTPFLMLGLGGLIHVVADCATVSGVRAMTPFSTKIFVFFQRSWRFRTGGSAEFGLLLLFALMAWGGYTIGSLGGLTSAIGHISKAPKIMFEEHQLKGLTICYVEGKFRWINGQTDKVRWLVIGTTGQGKMTLMHEGRLIRTPEQGTFLKAELFPTEDKWGAAKLKGWYITENEAFYNAEGEWQIAPAGSVVMGSVIGRSLVLTSYMENNQQGESFFDTFDEKGYL